MQQAFLATFVLIAVLALWPLNFALTVICAQRWPRVWQVFAWSAGLTALKAVLTVALNAMSPDANAGDVTPSVLLATYLLSVVFGFIILGLLRLKRRFSPLLHPRVGE